MPGKTPQRKGGSNKPVENGVRSTKDVEGGKGKAKKSAANDTDEEMTVVVPPSKKQSSAPPPADADGDVAMGDEEKGEEGPVEVDPAVQAVAGTFSAI